MKHCYYFYYESHINKRLHLDQFFSEQGVKEANEIHNLDKSFRTKLSLTLHNGSHTRQHHFLVCKVVALHTATDFDFPWEVSFPKALKNGLVCDKPRRRLDLLSPQ